MDFERGILIGRFQVVEQIGAGGNGVVYRAYDTGLGRDVALKVLFPEFGKDTERLRRFEQEARAASSLNHPNIVTVYEIGVHENAPYLVSELLEGHTLRDELRAGSMPVRKALNYAAQIANGIAAAHEKGIVHRDLKPENIFVTGDRGLKILDFGLAKLVPERSALSDSPTIGTGPGIILGTVGYMSPEQVRGESADSRSDIFSIGVVVYEMLTGTRPFQGETAVETMHIILKDDPADLKESLQISPPIENLVRHCLEKNPGRRYQSARDLAFHLEGVTGVSSLHSQRIEPLRRSRASIIGTAFLLLVVLAAGWGFYAYGRRRNPATPSFQRLTFRRGTIQSARLTPGGDSVVYSAAWDGLPSQVFSTRAGNPESRAFGYPDSIVLALSSKAELALGLRMTRDPSMGGRTGTLATAPLDGSTAREILNGVSGADWSGDGSALAVIRDPGRRIEFPVGKVLAETSGYFQDVRIAPSGKMLAFIEHPVPKDDRGFVGMVDALGKKTVLTGEWASVQGLAWSSDGREIWFTASEKAASRALRAVTPEGSQRIIMQTPGTQHLLDIHDGKVLLASESWRFEILGSFPGESLERNLSWFDLSIVNDIAADGRTIAFHEDGDGGGPDYSTYLRHIDALAPVRLGPGGRSVLSPDGRFALSITPSLPEKLMLLPTGAGEARTLPSGGITVFDTAGWTPDGRHVVFGAIEPKHGSRIYLQDLDGGLPQPITDEGVGIGSQAVVDGKSVLGQGPDRTWSRYPLNGGKPEGVPGLKPTDDPLRFDPTGVVLYVAEKNQLPIRIFRLNINNGRRELWKEIAPSDRAGVEAGYALQITPDGKYYVYSFQRLLSDLYLVEGLR
jgi:serine/threonine protein kinase